MVHHGRSRASRYNYGHYALLLSVIFLSCLTTLPASAQLKLPKLPGGNIQIPGVDSLFKEEEPITTSINDARGEIPYLDGYTPSVIRPLAWNRRSRNGGWLLRPGAYGSDIQTYCLHAGTYGPTKGNGYLYAPLKGKRATVIAKILRNSSDHPEIPQQEIQALIWAIEARAKYDTLNPNLKSVATTLLDDRDIAGLNSGGMGVIPSNQQNQVFGKLDSFLRPVYEAQNNLRGLLAQANAPFDELEKVAVLNGDPPKNKNDREVPGGRWMLHPDKFFVRYLPESYSKTQFEIYIPENFAVERDKANRIALVLCEDGSQVEATYNDAVSGASDDGKLHAWAFATLRISVPSRTAPHGVLVKEWMNRGWSFAGTNAERGGRLSNAASFPGYEERLQSASDLMRQLDELKKHYGGSKDKTQWGNYSDVVDIAHFRAGVEDVVRSDGDAWPKQVDTLTRGWMAALGKWAGGGSPSDKPSVGNLLPNLNTAIPDGFWEFIPSGDVAVPCDTGRQRLAMSPRPYPTKNDYSLTIYVDAKHGEPGGHVFISLANGEERITVGFYPVEESNTRLKQLLRNHTGQIRNDSDKMADDWDVKKTFSITREGFSNACAAIDSWPLEWSPTHHCGHFAAEVANASQAAWNPSPALIAAQYNPKAFDEFLRSTGGKTNAR